MIEAILQIFKKNTKYFSETYPTERYAFVIDTPSANTVYFRTKYYGDWSENIQACFTTGDDFFRICIGSNRFKTTDLNLLDSMLSELHKKKVIQYNLYLSNEYSDISRIQCEMANLFD